MAKTSFDTTKWLKEDLGFSDEEVKTLGPMFDKRKDKVEGGYLRQADYSRNIAEVQKLQTALAAKDAQLNSEMAEWAALQAGDETKAAALRTELEQTRVEKFQLEQKIKTLAEEHGIDVTKVLPATPTPDPSQKKVETPVFDENKYIPRDQFGQVVDYMLGVPAELSAIEREHFALTGEHLDTRPLIVDLKSRIAAKKPADLRTIWEEKFSIPVKRTEAAKAAHDAEIKAAEERGAQMARSESQIPGQHPTGAHAPVFTRAQGESKVARPQPGRNAQSFAESLRSRKYAPPVAETGRK